MKANISPTFYAFLDLDGHVIFIIFPYFSFDNFHLKVDKKVVSALSNKSAWLVFESFIQF